jgi:hypothetical protein
MQDREAAGFDVVGKWKSPVGLRLKYFQRVPPSSSAIIKPPVGGFVVFGFCAVGAQKPKWWDKEFPGWGFRPVWFLRASAKTREREAHERL